MTKYKVTPKRGAAYFIWAANYYQAVKQAGKSKIEEI
jgi:uncharacterized protein (UPF0262 family)